MRADRTSRPRNLKLAVLVIGGTLLLASCQPLAAPASERPASPGAEPTAEVSAGLALDGTAELAVLADPAGAAVSIDGTPRGASPLTLTLPAGVHQVGLSAPGYAPLSEAVTLTAGQRGILAPTLLGGQAPSVRVWADTTTVPWLGETQVHAQATANSPVSEMQVSLNGQVLGSVRGNDLTLALQPSAVPGVAPGGVYTLTARVVDQAGNTAESAAPITIAPTTVGAEASAGGAAAGSSSQPATTAVSPSAAAATGTPAVPASSAGGGTPPPTETAPSGQARVISPTTLTISSISIPTYPFAAFVQNVADPARMNYPVPVLNRLAYEASHPQPAPVKYTLIVLENKYLRLSMLPELGGRVYECIFKPTGHDEFYRNPVVKPSHWGPGPDISPAGANWWLAVGGLEWGFPVAEHGYEWSTQWGYDPVSQGDGSVMVSLFTRDYRRPYVDVDIILPPDAAYFIVRPHITNPMGAAFRFKWWADAMLAPGGANKPGAGLHFVYPVDEMTVHTTDDATLPGVGQPLPWPVAGGRDLSRLGNWNGYLGFFERPAAQGDFTAVYDPVSDEGMVRTFPSAIARGAKGFALGWKKPLDPHEWTDDGSAYVEMHGGLAPTFDDWNELPPGGSVTWSETWYPAAKIGDITYANAHAALNLTRSGSGVRVRAFPTEPIRGSLSVAAGGSAPVVRPLDIAPDRPLDEEIPAGPGPLKVVLTGAQDETLLSYTLP